jgi:hypothetical protein
MEKLMVFRSDSGVRWLLVPLLLGLLVATESMALNDADVAKLSKECEAAREVALAPIREQRTQDCIEQQLRSEDHCKRYYTTYGNVTVRAGNAPIQGYFYDLPECVECLDARNALRVSRSRP